MPGPDASAPSQTERVLGGRYRLIRPIAKGGMAEVWEGYDDILSRPVAVKTLLPHLATDQNLVERFRREAVAAARLSHPGVVATYDTGSDQGTAWIVMELVRGHTLRQLLNERGPMDPPMAIDVAGQIADALAHAHRAGLVHRDIKPANVLLVEDDAGPPRAKVTDFGIAKATEGLGLDLTKTGMVLGTPKYLSPEQVEGQEPDARADLYSLGVVLYEMVTCSVPFEGPTDMATAVAHVRQLAPRVSSIRPDVPTELDQLVADLLAKDPNARVPSAVSLRQALARIPLGTGDTPLPVSVRLGGLATPPPPPPAAGAPPGGPGFAPRPIVGSAAPPVGRDAKTDNGSIPATQTPLGVSPANALSGGVGQANALAGHERLTDSVVGGGAPGAGGPAATGVLVREAPRPATPPPARRRRHWWRWISGTTVLVLVVAGAVTASALISGTSLPQAAHKVENHLPAGLGGDGSGPGTSVATTPVSIGNVQVWMNVTGRPKDNADETGLTIDGNQITFWSTDNYKTPQFGGLYSGFGLAIRLNSTHTVHQLTVTTETQGWGAQTYVANSMPANGSPVTAWGSPTDSQTNIAGSSTFNLDGKSGGWVLLWLTDLGPADQAQVNELGIN